MELKNIMIIVSNILRKIKIIYHQIQLMNHLKISLINLLKTHSINFPDVCINSESSSEVKYDKYGIRTFSYSNQAPKKDNNLPEKN